MSSTTNQADDLQQALSSARAWRWAALALVVAMVGYFAGRAESKEQGPTGRRAQPAPNTVIIAGPVQVRDAAVAQAAEEPVPADTFPGLVDSFGAPVQPSSSVEATAMAIAYDALRGKDKTTAEAVGKYAAEMMNAFSAARK